MEGSSILDFMGQELIGVMTPVSICMLLVVLLISTLTTTTTTTPSQTPIITAANLVYSENPHDTTLQKLQGSLLNALVFVILIAIVTFVLVCLYYYNFTTFLKNYIRFSAFLILFTMGGSIFLSLIRHFDVPVDGITYFVLLLNFSVVGVFSVFGKGVPIIVTQCYTVCLGLITAAWFTQLPEWTTWALLVALSVYDLVAVLAPGGPLKILVELAQSRDDDLPALVYESRPTVSDGGPGPGPGPGRRGSLGLLIDGVSDNGSIELQGSSGNHGVGSSGSERVDSNEEIDLESGRGEGGGETLPLVSNSWGSQETGSVSEARSPLVEILAQGMDEDGGESDLTMTRGIKLGLGDFVFYSVLVGRAAMYDLMTVYACYLAIISGLACTLMLLSVCGRALPALPISITLGVVFYFLTRLLMEPFVVHTSTNLLMF